MESDDVYNCFSDIKEELYEKRSELEKLEDDVSHTIAKKLQSHQQRIIKSSKNISSGLMYNSFDISKDGNGTYLMGNTATSYDGFPYPLAIETGRRTVYPINAKMLRWWGSNGEIIFAKKSSATTPHPFVQPSIDATMRDIERIVHKKIDGIFD